MTVSQELRAHVRCIVTHPSKNGEFKKGDVIWLDDGAIMKGAIKAWMAAEDVPEATEGMEVKSATPIAAELREWAMYSRQTARKAYPLPWRADRYRFTSNMLVNLKPDDRRTFALLVACALEDDA